MFWQNQLVNVQNSKYGSDKCKSTVAGNGLKFTQSYLFDLCLCTNFSIFSEVQLAPENPDKNNFAYITINHKFFYPSFLVDPSTLYHQQSISCHCVQISR